MRGFSAGFSSDFYNNHKELLSELSLHPDFLVNLQKDDDWSFVIKLHSLMEIAFSQLLSEHFGKNLESIFYHLEMGNKKYGKMVFVRQLSLIPSKKLLEFVDLLTEMRNTFAHDIRTIHTGIAGYINALKKKKSDKYDRWVSLLGVSQNNKHKINLSDGTTIPLINYLTTITRSNMTGLAIEVLSAANYGKIDARATQALQKDLNVMALDILAKDFEIDESKH